QVFRRRAETLAADIRQKFENVKISLNPEKPRRGSFEVTLTPNSGKDSEVIWTGLKKGPPRKLKFPESEVIIKDIQKNLK
ncbi:selenoprotein H-like, partial [Littorina saxatilis]|uniref:selenoprotein H-like n=1 Tax=Littorina saxatilis TaxID=31220 RepID=UPI0038B674EF